MRILALVCAFVTVFAIGSLIEAVRAAVPGGASQKAPSFYRLSPDDPAAEQACKDKGGTVSTDQDGYKICTLARACPAAGGPTRATKLDANDPTAAKKCKDACGVISTDKDGAQVCTKPEES